MQARADRARWRERRQATQGKVTDQGEEGERFEEETEEVDVVGEHRTETLMPVGFLDFMSKVLFTSTPKIKSDVLTLAGDTSRSYAAKIKNLGERKVTMSMFKACVAQYERQRPSEVLDLHRGPEREEHQYQSSCYCLSSCGSERAAGDCDKGLHQVREEQVERHEVNPDPCPDDLRSWRCRSC